jgi:hypothetical protein
MLTDSRLYRFGSLIALLLAMILALMALAYSSKLAAGQSTTAAAATGGNWHASYWDNMDLAGTPVVERLEPAIDHNWGYASPDPRIPSDYFSARWLRYVDLPAGVYHFSATSDDGVRVYVDDQLIIAQWHVHAQESYVAGVVLAGG